jgi:hypothetical protein
VEKENKKEKFERELMGAKLCGKSHCASSFFFNGRVFGNDLYFKIFFIKKYIKIIYIFLYQRIKITLKY